MKTRSTPWTSRVAVLLTLLLLSSVATGLAASHEGDKTTAAEVKEETSETYEALKHYTVEQRKEAMAAAEKKLAKLDASIDEMQNTIDERWQSMSKATREKYRKSIALLRQQRYEAAEWFGGMRQSSAEAWEDVKKGFAASYDRLETAFKEASKSFKDEK